MSHLFQLGETRVSPFSIPGSNTADIYLAGGTAGAEVESDGTQPRFVSDNRLISRSAGITWRMIRFTFF